MIPIFQTAKKTSYKAFGLNISSELLLPEFPQMSGDDNQVDLSVEVADLSVIWSIFACQAENFIVKKKFVMFQVPGVAIFSIHEGKKIIVSPMRGSDEHDIRQHILGTCLGVLLIQRKILPLHGTAVAIDGKAYAFIGDPSAGVSSLAAALLHREYVLLSRDMVAVWVDQDRKAPYVMPTYFHTKSFHSIPLAGILEYVKAENNKFEVRPIESLDRLSVLFLHTYCNFMIPDLDLDWHLETSVCVAGQIDMFRVSRPSLGFTSSRLIDSILAVLNRGGDANEMQI